MKRFGWALLTGIVFTLILSAGNIGLLMRGELTTARMMNHGTDEAYYFALIRDGATGYPNLGHVAFKEHRFERMTGSYAPAVEGLMMRALGVSLPVMALLGDIVFTLLAVTLLAYGLMHLFESAAMGGIVAFGITCLLGTYWMRSANPQIPYILVTGWIAAFFVRSERPWIGMIVRAGCIGLLLYMQLLYASLLLIIEGTFFLHVLVTRRKEWKQVFYGAVIFTVPFVILLIPKIILMGASDPATQDTLHRAGMIPTHFPSAPQLQLQLIILGGLLLITRRRRIQYRNAIDLLLIIIAGSLIGLNQAVIHGIDATYGSYYANVVIFFFWITAAFIVHAWVQHRIVRGALTLLFLAYGILFFAGQLRDDREIVKAAIAAEEAAGLPAVIDWLASEQGELVIAAPRELGNLIPASTDHYVLINSYAFNQKATDRELAERFLLHQALFADDFPSDPSYPQVFGGYPGLLAAKRRTGCQIMIRLGLASGPCIYDPQSLIIYQDVLAMLKTNKPDVRGLLKKYQIDLIVADQSDTPALCPEIKKIGRWSVMRCGSR